MAASTPGAVQLGRYMLNGTWTPFYATGAAVAGWSAFNGTWSVVAVSGTYEPGPVSGWLLRTTPRSGETVSLPDPEAAALVAAGLAAYAAGWSPSTGPQLGFSNHV